MNDDQLLVAWLCGALEPGEQRRVAEAIASHPALARRVERLRARLAAHPRRTTRRRAPAPRWEPARPPWGCRTRSRPAHRLGDAPSTTVEIDGPPDAWLVLVRRDGEEWRVVFPEVPEDLVRLGEIPKREVDLAGGAEWIVALPADLDGLSWEDPPASRWAPLFREIDAGRVPYVVVRT